MTAIIGIYFNTEFVLICTINLSPTDFLPGFQISTQVFSRAHIPSNSN